MSDAWNTAAALLAPFVNPLGGIYTAANGVNMLTRSEVARANAAYGPQGAATPQAAPSPVPQAAPPRPAAPRSSAPGKAPATQAARPAVRKPPAKTPPKGGVRTERMEDRVRRQTGPDGTLRVGTKAGEVPERTVDANGNPVLTVHGSPDSRTRVPTPAEAGTVAKEDPYQIPVPDPSKHSEDRARKMAQIDHLAQLETIILSDPRKYATVPPDYLNHLRTQRERLQHDLDIADYGPALAEERRKAARGEFDYQVHPDSAKTGFGVPPGAAGQWWLNNVMPQKAAQNRETVDWMNGIMRLPEAQRPATFQGAEGRRLAQNWLNLPVETRVALMNTHGSGSVQTTTQPYSHYAAQARKQGLSVPAAPFPGAGTPAVPAQAASTLDAFMARPTSPMGPVSPTEMQMGPIFLPGVPPPGSATQGAIQLDTPDLSVPFAAPGDPTR